MKIQAQFHIWSYTWITNPTLFPLNCFPYGELYFSYIFMYGQDVKATAIGRDFFIWKWPVTITDFRTDRKLEHIIKNIVKCTEGSGKFQVQFPLQLFSHPVTIWEILTMHKKKELWCVRVMRYCGPYFISWRRSILTHRRTPDASVPSPVIFQHWAGPHSHFQFGKEGTCTWPFWFASGC